MFTVNYSCVLNFLFECTLDPIQLRKKNEKGLGEAEEHVTNNSTSFSSTL